MFDAVRNRFRDYCRLCEVRAIIIIASTSVDNKDGSFFKRAGSKSIICMGKVMGYGYYGHIDRRIKKPCPAVKGVSAFKKAKIGVLNDQGKVIKRDSFCGQAI